MLRPCEHSFQPWKQIFKIEIKGAAPSGHHVSGKYSLIWLVSYMASAGILGAVVLHVHMWASQSSWEIRENGDQKLAGETWRTRCENWREFPGRKTQEISREEHPCTAGAKKWVLLVYKDTESQMYESVHAGNQARQMHRKGKHFIPGSWRAGY